jgi:hypothetical protein
VRRLPIAVVAACVLACATPARADLIDLGDGTILSSDLGYAFLRDFNTARTTGYDADGRMWLNEAFAWIDHLNVTAYLGYSDWQIAGGANPPGPERSVEYEAIEYLFNVELGAPPRGTDARISALRAGTGPFVNVQLGSDAGYFVSNYVVDCGPGGMSGGCFGPNYRVLPGEYDDLIAPHYVTAMRRPQQLSIPEPSTAMLLAMGVVTAAFRARRRRLA